MGFSDNFNRTDSGTIGNSWTEEHAATFEILSNKCRGTADGTQYYDAQLLRPSGEAWADGTVTTDFQFITATDGIAQVHARCQGTNDNIFYLAYINGTLLVLAKLSGSYTTISTTSVGTLSTGTNYQLSLTCNGTSLDCSLKDLDSPSTLGSISTTDSTVTGSGKQAISVGAGGNPIDYDNFTSIALFASANVSESITITDSVTFIIGVHWTTELDSSGQTGWVQREDAQSSPEFWGYKWGYRWGSGITWSKADNVSGDWSSTTKHAI